MQYLLVVIANPLMCLSCIIPEFTPKQSFEEKIEFAHSIYFSTQTSSFPMKLNLLLFREEFGGVALAQKPKCSAMSYKYNTALSFGVYFPFSSLQP